MDKIVNMVIINIKAGLGNQLFQFAAARYLSLSNNLELKVDLSFYKDDKNRNAFRLDKLKLPIEEATESELSKFKNLVHIPMFFRILKRFGLKHAKYYKKTHKTEADIRGILKQNQPLTGDYYLEGWFANDIYFKSIRNLLINDICSHVQLSGENLIKQNEISKVNSVAVHIRRGDFLTNTYFKVLPIEYYSNAINRAMKEIENPVFYFFSNDTDWTKKAFSNISNAIFVDHNSEADTEYSTRGDINDLMLIRFCKHQIIANSTFSWWGAWLNENPDKRVFYPSKYFNNIKAQKQYEKHSFMPDEWIKIHF